MSRQFDEYAPGDRLPVRQEEKAGDLGHAGRGQPRRPTLPALTHSSNRVSYEGARNLVALQRSVGNRAVAHLLAVRARDADPAVTQRSQTHKCGDRRERPTDRAGITHPGDPTEREADHVGDAMPGSCTDHLVDVVFASGRYQPATATSQRLPGPELAHVVQHQHAPAVVQTTSLTERASGDPAANPTADTPVNWRIEPPSTALTSSGFTLTLQRTTTSVTIIDPKGSKTTKPLTQGLGGSGAVLYQYSAHKTERSQKQSDVDLPLLVYPPATLKLPKVDLFVFFHGRRADYGEKIGGARKQGSEPIGLWSHLKEAVAGTDRLGIAPQAPETWFKNLEGIWTPNNAQWDEALTNVGFDGLIDIVLKGLTRDLGLSTRLAPGDIHVAGHSAGGKGIKEATNRGGGAKTYGDQVQHVTLQDAGYGSSWEPLMDWFLDGRPGKTIRVLISEGGPRAVLSTFNVRMIRDAIRTKRKGGALEVEGVSFPGLAGQKPRPGGFVLESKLTVKNKTINSVQGTMVVFFAPDGGHYETVTSSMGAAAAAGPGITEEFLGEVTLGKYRVISAVEKAIVFKDKDLTNPVRIRKGGKTEGLALKLDTIVEVTELQPDSKRRPRGYVAKIKSADGEGWMRLTHLAPPTTP